MIPPRLLFTRSRRALLDTWLIPLLQRTHRSLEPPPLLVEAGPAPLRRLREVLVTRRAAGLLPRLVSWRGFLDEFCLRHVSHRAPLEDEAHARLAVQVLQAHPGRWPWLQRLQEATDLGESLATLHQGLLQSSVPSLEAAGAPHGAELDDFLATLNPVIAALPGHRPRGLLFADLRRALDEPGPTPLSRALEALPGIFLLGFTDGSALDRQLLLALARATARARRPMVLVLPMEHRAHLYEPDAFFTGDPAHPLTPDIRSLQGTAATRRQLFESLVATGEADMLVLDSDGPSPVDPAQVPREPDPGGPIRGEAAHRLALLRCPDPSEEERILARQVKSRLLEGASPADLLVAVADLPTRRERVRAAFEDHGIPLDLAIGPRLVESPVVTAVLLMVRLALHRYPAEDLLSFLESDLVWSPPPLQPRRLRRRGRMAGIRGGEASAWREPLHTALGRHLREQRVPEDRVQRHLARLDQELEVLSTVQSWLAPLAEPATPDEFRFRVLETAERFRIPRRAGRFPARPELAAEGLVAWGDLQHTLEEWVRACRPLGETPWPPGLLVDRLTAQVRRRRQHPPPAQRDGVRVVPAWEGERPGELDAAPPAWVWLAGLSAGAFPPPPPDRFLVPGSVARRLATADPPSIARGLLGSLLRELEDDPDFHLTLSWPATREGRPAPPAPALAEILDRPVQGPVDPVGTGGSGGADDVEGFLRDRVRDASAQEPAATVPLARSDVARLAAMDPSWNQTCSPPLRKHRQRQEARARSRRSTMEFGPWDGILERPPPIPSPLSVTALETYLRCPARAFHRHVLGLAPLEEHEPELRPHRSGRLLHRVLERFVAPRCGQSLESRPPDGDRRARHALHRILEEAIEEERQQGTAHPALLSWLRDRWGAGLLDSGPAGVLAAWLQYEQDRGFGLHPLEVEMGALHLGLGPTRVSAKVDRVDGDGDGCLLVIDYKTGRSPTGTDLRRALALQPVVYAELARRRLAPDFPAPDPPAPDPAEVLPEQPELAFAFQELRDPDDIRYRGWYGDPPLVKRLAGGRAARSAPHREEGTQLLAWAAEAAHRWARGVFHTTLASPVDAGCPSCPYARICGVDPLRNAAIAEGDGDLQRPRDPAADSPTSSQESSHG